MRPSRPSRTAQAVCLFRAVEHARAPRHRIVDDPLATAFLPWPLRALAQTWSLAPPSSIIGLATYVLARHAFIDEAIKGHPEAQQVVLLGAGYDSRAWRLRDHLGTKVVWEVDHPATARAKARRARDLTPVPRRVVTVDFQHQSLHQRLLDEGFDASLPTFWVWEGVSMYLTRQAVEDTLSVVRSLSAPGSRLAMDVWHYLDAPDIRSTLRRSSASMLAVFSEPITFGVHPSDASGFFAANGFDAVQVATADALMRGAGSKRRWAMPECYVALLSPV